jgi:hypothetical protein
MYEIKSTAESIGELRGRIIALAAEMTPAEPVTQSGIAARLAEAKPLYVPEVDTLEAGFVLEKFVIDEPVVEEPEFEEPVVGEPVTYEQVRTAILQVSVKHGRDAVSNILAAFGATKNAKEIDPSLYAEVLATAKQGLGVVCCLKRKWNSSRNVLKACHKRQSKCLVFPKRSGVSPTRRFA